ncbi:unnamed protein product [Fusarium langsethiae]|nr:unnamed protein product [Fusarium langsethiae]
MDRKQIIHITEHGGSQIELPNDRHQSMRENHAMQHRLAKWRITPRQPTVMCLFFICGIALAIGHHVFYRSMSGTFTQSAESQQWAIRVGSLFALLATVCFRACVTMSFTQVIWRTFRRHGIEISVIDKIFALTSDPLSFLSLRVLQTAHLGVL